MATSYSSMFTLRNFTVSGLAFKSLIHFKLIFMYGVRLEYNFILSHVDIQFSDNHWLKRLSFPHCVFLAPSLKTSSLHMSGFTSGLSILFHRSICLYLHQHHTVLITVALWYILKSGIAMPPALFFFLNIALTICGHLWFQVNFRIFFFYFCEKCYWDFDGNPIELVDHFG